MGRHERVHFLVPAALAVLLLGAGVASGQAGQPECAEDFFADLEGWAEEHNARAGTDGTGELPDWLLRDQRVNLYVEADDCAGTVYSFSTDGRVRVVELDRGPREDATVRAWTTAATLDRIEDEDDPVAALHRAILTREIRVQRVVRLPLGVVFAVGVPEVAIGVIGLVTVAAVLAKGGASVAVSVLQTGTSRLTVTVRGRVDRGWRGMGREVRLLLDALSALSVLDMFGLVDVERRVRALWGWLIARLRRVRERLRQALSRDEDAPDRRRRE